MKLNNCPECEINQVCYGGDLYAKIDDREAFCKAEKIRNLVDFKVTPNFWFSEFIKTNHKEYLRDNYAYAVENYEKVEKLAQLLERVRELCENNAVIITSSVRCRKLNEIIKGSPTSQHCRGEAADFTVKNKTVDEIFEIIKLSDIEFGQLILEKVNGVWWIHLSLGYPYREKERCNEVFIYDGKKYTKIER
ncbi:hypothetical protein Dip510_000819 [Elusimicrobium posterum]|uniref:D-Ala-D-Ala carboxypeptidase family metallohydrolase n=1 Tax=Elusimicrobium posterum TaxID=3116653 RepID=UPI003C746CEF